MKDERKQSKKHHESTIGKIIYGFLLFMPLFAIGTTCLISTFNMASKEESEIHYKYATNEVNSSDDLVKGRIYHFYCDNTSFAPFSNSGGYISIEVIDLQTFYLNYDYIDTAYVDEFNFNEDLITKNTTLEFGETNLYIYSPSYNSYYSLAIDYNQMGAPFNFEGDFIYIDSYLLGSDIVNYASICENIPIDYVETHNVEPQDVFYNSIDKVQQSPLFNWTTNTGIYTVLNNTCNSLGITTTFVPLLLAYWLIISVMYFLYDIVLIILNILHRKIHELQESI